MDQGLKTLLKNADQPLIPGVIKLLGIRNTGVSFGLLAGHPEMVALITLALILLAGLFLRRMRLGAWAPWGQG